ncbi:hypothetical protein EDD29_0791 [Actinocorallia herbida]|uniref:Uncharacterized protein n=1 Tax=Actinocorallia herbida TaxID=58109 RepID=A0A3N1CQ22_9ACTN|nr:hypothetical protein [Actinocorallia herbida]ROO83295.1 hypothetical protein EDD29_0791 [Actinocorallia herbida]
MRASWPGSALRTALRRSCTAICLVLVAGCGGYTPTGRLDAAPLPTPDICAGLPPDLVKATLGAAPSACDSGTEGGTHGARFTAGKGANAVVLVVSYLSRYDVDTGLDLWQVYGYVEQKRVSLIGVGEDGVYDPETGIASAVEAQFIVRVAVQSSAGMQNHDGEGEKLMPVLEAALGLGRAFTAASTPSRGPSAPVIVP